MKEFKEINPYNRLNKQYEEKESKFIENPIGSNHMKIEFGSKLDTNNERKLIFNKNIENWQDDYDI